MGYRLNVSRSSWEFEHFLCRGCKWRRHGEHAMHQKYKGNLEQTFTTDEWNAMNCLAQLWGAWRRAGVPSIWIVKEIARVKSGGTCPKSTWMEACFVISHGTAPDSRRLQAKLEAFKLLWTCFKYALYVWSSESVFEWRHFIYFIDSVDCGLFCGFFCVSFSLHTEVWCERGLCGRSWTSWVDQLLLGCKMLHRFTSRTS